MRRGRHAITCHSISNASLQVQNFVFARGVWYTLPTINETGTLQKYKNGWKEIEDIDMSALRNELKNAKFVSTNVPEKLLCSDGIRRVSLGKDFMSISISPDFTLSKKMSIFSNGIPQEQEAYINCTGISPKLLCRTDRMAITPSYVLLHSSSITIYIRRID